MINSILCGDSIEILKSLPDNSIDACVTDPPYGFAFMGKERDDFSDDPKHYQEFSYLWAKEVLRVLKPGGHLLSFGGTRTYHRMACGIEDAGFEIRDCIMWVYGEGFPKSLNIGKHYKDWEGWGTALKPAVEPVVLARKPLEKGLSIAQNVLKWRTGGLNIDGCRIPLDVGDSTYKKPSPCLNSKNNGTNFNTCKLTGSITDDWKKGRFPANLIHDGSQLVLDLFPMSRGSSGSWNKDKYPDSDCGVTNFRRGHYRGYNDGLGSAARFFYCAKAKTKERNAGCEHLSEKARNHHPTVKPIELCRYLCRLITPKDGIVLDPFAGSGTIPISAMLEGFNYMEGFNYIGIEKEPDYVEIALARLNYFKNMS